MTKIRIVGHEPHAPISRDVPPKQGDEIEVEVEVDGEFKKSRFRVTHAEAQSPEMIAVWVEPI